MVEFIFNPYWIYIEEQKWNVFDKLQSRGVIMESFAISGLATSGLAASGKVVSGL